MPAPAARCFDSSCFSNADSPERRRGERSLPRPPIRLLVRRRERGGADGDDLLGVRGLSRSGWRCRRRSAAQTCRRRKHRRDFRNLRHVQQRGHARHHVLAGGGGGGKHARRSPPSAARSAPPSLQRGGAPGARASASFTALTPASLAAASATGRQPLPATSTCTSLPENGPSPAPPSAPCAWRGSGSCCRVRQGEGRPSDHSRLGLQLLNQFRDALDLHARFARCRLHRLHHCQAAARRRRRNPPASSDRAASSWLS